MVRKSGVQEKEIVWIGTAYSDFLTFPATAKRDAGYQLHRVQNDLPPENWKIISELGAGVCELRLREDTGIFRVMYVAKFDDAIYVLHCFKKKTQKMTGPDKEVTSARYKAVCHYRRGPE